MIRFTYRRQDSPKRLQTYSLRILNGCRKGQSISIRSISDFFVGRSRRCDLRIMSTTVSRMHCRLRLSECGALCVYDMNSVTGTFVNDRRVVGPKTLNVGDVLRIGPVKAQVVLGVPATESGRYSFEPLAGVHGTGDSGSSPERPTYILHDRELSNT